MSVDWLMSAWLGVPLAVAAFVLLFIWEAQIVTVRRSPMTLKVGAILTSLTLIGLIVNRFVALT